MFQDKQHLNGYVGITQVSATFKFDEKTFFVKICCGKQNTRYIYFLIYRKVVFKKC